MGDGMLNKADKTSIAIILMFPLTVTVNVTPMITEPCNTRTLLLLDCGLDIFSNSKRNTQYQCESVSSSSS